jgi:magnesium transporter
MQKHYRIDNGHVVQVHLEAGPITVFVNPDENEKRFLLDELKLDEHTLGSALDPDELARLEFEPQHVALIFKRPKNYSGGGSFLLEVSSIGAFLFKERLVIVVSDEAPLFEGAQFTKVTGLTDLLLRMVYRSNFHFLEHLKIIDKISDELQKKVNASMENRYLINMFELQKSLVYYQSSISSNGALVEKLRMNSAKIGFTPEEQEYLEDVAIEINQCYKQAEINSNILASLMDARVSIVSNNLNILIKILNIITIGIMVPTLIVSIFSMNVLLPFQHSPVAFWIIIGFALVAVAGFMLIYRRMKW